MPNVGLEVGTLEGCRVGRGEGSAVGDVGAFVGIVVGRDEEGVAVGRTVGLPPETNRVTRNNKRKTTITLLGAI